MNQHYILLASFAAFCLTTAAQQPGPRGPQAMIKSNEEAGVDIDRFIGNAAESPTHLSHGLLLTHSMLHAGDPYNAGKREAVLEYRKDLSVATLLPKNHTPMETLPEQFMFYIESGDGRLDDGKQFWDLRQNVAVLIPPNSPHRIVNNSDKPLTMIMASWTPSAPPRAEILVRDVDKLPWCEEAVHWNNNSKCIFGAADGLFQSERIYLVMLQPWAMSQPHSHVTGTEEVWTKVSPGVATILLGSELREMPENSAYLVPPTGETEHANMNLTKDRIDWWLYIAHGPAQPAASPPPTTAAAATNGAGGRPRNPNVVRDHASVEQATVPGTPLH